MLDEFVVSKVAQVLAGAEGRTLQEMICGLGVSKVTTLKWLRSMERKGLLCRSYEVKQGKRGRPRGVYHQTKNLKRFIEEPPQGDGSMVTLSLTTLRSICRYEKGRMCKALLPKLQRCETSLCPYLKL